MKKDNITQRLENLNVKPVVPPESGQIKLAIISSKKSARLSWWLLSVPFIFLLGIIIDSLFHFAIPPWSILKDNSYLWPVWIRVGIFSIVVIIIPVIVVFLNLLAIIFMNYDREQKVLNIAIRFKMTNIIILVISGMMALLFIGHSIVEWIAGT